MTRQRGPREDEICGSWVPLTDGPGRLNRPRLVCARRYHPTDPNHRTASGMWVWADGDLLAHPHDVEPFLPFRANCPTPANSDTAKGAAEESKVSHQGHADESNAQTLDDRTISGMVVEFGKAVNASIEAGRPHSVIDGMRAAATYLLDTLRKDPA